jgi:septal ring factor EnvC (AmiA/AmiB activator)
MRQITFTCSFAAELQFEAFHARHPGQYTSYGSSFAIQADDRLSEFVGCLALERAEELDDEASELEHLEAERAEERAEWNAREEELEEAIEVRDDEIGALEDQLRQARAALEAELQQGRARVLVLEDQLQQVRAQAVVPDPWDHDLEERIAIEREPSSRWVRLRAPVV